jgi:predicted MPP superfamily phosphohydrolase
MPDKSVRFVQVSDIHYDPYFCAAENANSWCHCVGNSKTLRRKVPPVFGDAGSACDSPLDLVNATFDYIKNMDVDVILWTGDSGRHDRDPMIRHPIQDVKSQNRIVTEYFKKSFGTVQVLPSIGNWDTESKNNASPKDLKWLFEQWAPLWNQYERESIAETFLVGGFYEWRHPKGLSFLSLNTLSWFIQSTENGYIVFDNRLW